MKEIQRQRSIESIQTQLVRIEGRIEKYVAELAATDDPHSIRCYNELLNKQMEHHQGYTHLLGRYSISDGEPKLLRC